MAKNKISSILYFISGGLFLMASLIDGNMVFTSIGCTYIVIGCIFLRKKDDLDDDKNK